MEFIRIFHEFIKTLIEAQGESDKNSRRSGIKLVTVTIFSGVVNAVLVAIIIISARRASFGSLDAKALQNHTSAATDNASFRLLALFGLCLLAFALSRLFVSIQSADMAEGIVANIRVRIADKIRRSNLLRYEQASKFEIDSALKHGTAVISWSAPIIANATSAVFMLLCAIAYIAFLSRSAFVLTAACIVTSLSFYFIKRKKFKQELRLSEEVEEHFYDLFTHLLEGFKEVKMYDPRNQDLYENYLVRTALEAEVVKRRTARLHASIAVLNQTALYLVLTVIIFALPSYNLQDASKISTIAAVILFSMGPLSELVAAVPISMRSHEAVVRIARLEEELDAAAGRVAPGPDLASMERHSFQNIALENVSFAYEKPRTQKGFKLDIAKFQVNAGQILFLVGGNGSGKSTLLKVLTGLYEPDQGDILVDGQPLIPSKLAEYRSLFSTVFADFHLFDQLYGLPDESYSYVEALLERMELDRLISLDDEGRFMSSRDIERDNAVSKLSTGQKKRLALIVALAENRPILVLDEFAADQDPIFREKFYQTILHEMRSQGRTIVAATHDDHYFQHADRILKMEFGRFEDITNQFHGRI